MENYICFAILSTGNKVKLTEQDYYKFNEADNDDFIEVKGQVFKKSAVMEIQDIKDWVDDQVSGYGQSYQALPPGIGFKGLIAREKRLFALEGMVRGLKKAKAKIEKEGRTTKNIDSLLDFAEKRIAKISG